MIFAIGLFPEYVTELIIFENIVMTCQKRYKDTWDINLAYDVEKIAEVFKRVSNKKTTKIDGYVSILVKNQLKNTTKTAKIYASVTQRQILTDYEQN